MNVWIRRNCFNKVNRLFGPHQCYRQINVSNGQGRTVDQKCSSLEVGLKLVENATWIAASRHVNAKRVSDGSGNDARAALVPALVALGILPVLAALT